MDRQLIYLMVVVNTSDRQMFSLKLSKSIGADVSENAVIILVRLRHRALR